MSSIQEHLPFLWQAEFEDGTDIYQPANDMYSKHDPNKPTNPSAFKDILDHQKISPLKYFTLHERSRGSMYGVCLRTGVFSIEPYQVGVSAEFSLEDQDEPLTDRKLIFYREVIRQRTLGGEETNKFGRFFMGYEGLNSSGKRVKKVISVHADQSR